MGNVHEPALPLAAQADVARRVEEMYTSHVRLVRSVCRSLLRDRNEAEDAVQQTFLSAQRALANGSSPREPAAWLAVIARNECLARVRERMREPLPVDAEPTEFGADAYSSAASNYEVATLREALADLPRAQREAILLREMRGLSYDEVARSLSLTTGAVESLIFRARRTLQVRLGEALSALSPVAMLGRFFGAGGGDVAAPVVKIAAVGVGAALLAGGAATIGPRALGLQHGGAHHATAPAPPSGGGSDTSSHWSARLLSTPAFAVAHAKGERDAGSKEPGSSDTRESTGSDSSGSDNSSSDGSGSDTSGSDSASSRSDSSSSDGSASEGDTATTPASTVPATTTTDTTTTDTSTDPTETTDGP